MKSKKLILLLALFMSQISIFAQNNSLPTTPNPPNPQTEGDGFGAVATPIDMYVYILAIAGILLTVYFAKKYKTQKI